MKLRYFNLWEAMFPSDLRRLVWRQIAAIVGFIMLGAALSFGLSLASWSAFDPSFNQATGARAANWLGGPGAIISDISMQTFGLGAVALAIVVAAWGWRLASGRTVRRPILRSMFTLLALTLAGGFASGLAAPDKWPLVAGLGGMFGDIAQSAARWLLSNIGGAQNATPATVVLAILALASAWYASAIVTGPGDGMEDTRPGPSGRQRNTSSASGTLDAGLAAIGRLALGTVALLWWALVWLFQRLTGRRREQEQSKLKIAMARAQDGMDDDLHWRPSGGPAQIHRPDRCEDDDPDNNPDDFSRRNLQKEKAGRSSFGMKLLKRIWNGDDMPVSHDDDHRVEPQLSDEDSHWGFKKPEDDGAREYGDDAPFDDTAPGAATSKGPARKRRKTKAGNTGFNHRGAADAEYQLPPLTLLNKPAQGGGDVQLSDGELSENARLLEGVLEDFGVRGEIINVRPGPVVTLYELEPAPGIKSSRVIGLADDIARSMSAISARVAVVPGRNVIGIELPNEHRETVFLYDLLASAEFTETKQTLALGLGKNIGGEPMVADLARMPHLLVAGTTGSGKSVGVNAMILSLLFRHRPDECKLIMIDPKMLELSVYDGIPHLLSPVVTEPGKAVVALKWAVREMEERYKNMSKLGVRNIDGFNKRVRDAEAKGEVLTRTVQTGFDSETGQAVYETEEMDLSPLPFIVVIVDEMADLMMVAGKDIEGAIQRLAQMARAAGLHLIMATQRPSVDVITGTIKANFPTRISFQVTSKIDSRTILGEMGAEQLLGQGDMLHMAGGGRIGRIHGAFVSDEEVESVVQFLKRQGVPEYLEAVTADTGIGGDGAGDGSYGGGGNISEADQLYDQAVAVVARDRKASTSYIQRRLSIGYNRAATIIERMENEGVVGAANHAGKREVLVPEPSFEHD